MNTESVSFPKKGSHHYFHFSNLYWYGLCGLYCDKKRHYQKPDYEKMYLVTHTVNLEAIEDILAGVFLAGLRCFFPKFCFYVVIVNILAGQKFNKNLCMMS